MANWPATLAAVHARGPRCDECGKWTFRSYMLTVPPGFRRCGECRPSMAPRSWGR